LRPLAFRSVTDGVAARLQPIFARHGIRPTYLVSPEVLRDPAARAVLERLPDSVELGSHLHGEHLGAAPDGPGDFQCQYPAEVELERMTRLAELFETSLGRRPRSFRAGRFGAGPNTLRCLEALGYAADGSVTPHMRWGIAPGEMDYTAAPEQPYFPAHANIARRGTSTVLEIPVSLVGTPVGDALRSALLLENGQGLVRRALRRVTRPRWLHPAIETVDVMLRVADTLVARHRARGRVVLTMMFHAGEVVAGATPSSHSDAAAAVVRARLDATLGALVAAGARPATMSDIARSPA
jgi:hypothetical protein